MKDRTREYVPLWGLLVVRLRVNGEDECEGIWLITLKYILK
jgi:hypothetical protein